jgi:hypothetical protein
MRQLVRKSWRAAALGTAAHDDLDMVGTTNDHYAILA